MSSDLFPVAHLGLVRVDQWVGAELQVRDVTLALQEESTVVADWE